MADQMPEMDPSRLIDEQAAALSARLVQVARDAVRHALTQGALVTVADVLAALESVAQTLTPALVAAIESALPEIARQAVIAAEVEIADARAESGKPFPSISPPPAGDYAGWAASAVTALVASLRKRVEPASSSQLVAVVADAGELSSKILEELDNDISAALSSLFDTAAARTVNESRMEVFRANSDVVRKVKVITVADAKRSEVCTNMNGATFDPKRPVPTPPFHAHCRSYLKAITGVRRKAGATEKEIARQNWAVFRRLQREAEGRADERLELRFAPTADATGTFTGVASAYGVLDAHGTEFAPGSFAANIAERRAEGRKVPLLLHHDPERPCGVVEEMRETPDGLMIEGRFILDTEAGREAHALAKAGAVALSVGFKRIADRARPDGGRIITEARLAEVSIVAVASNPKAAIIEVRGNSPAAGAAQQQEKRAMPDSIAAPADTGKDVNARVTALESKVDSIAAAVEEIKGGVKAAEQRADRIEARGARLPLGGGETRADIAVEHRAIAAFARGDERPLIELRSGMSVGSDADGGYVVMPQLSANMTKKLFDATPMRRLCRVETITTGDSWVEPIDADDVGAEWVGEQQARPDTDSPELGLLTVPLREIYARVPVTQRLLDDNGVNLGSWLEGKMTDKFIRSEGAAFVSSTATPKRPSGLLSYPTAATADASRAWGTLQFVKSGDASKITADGLKNLLWSLRAPYRDGAVFLMNSNTANALDTLVDSEGRYLWRSSMLAGSPNSLLGYPVEFSEDMPDVAGGAFPVAFGNFKRAYLIVDKLGIRFIRDPFSSKPNTEFYGYRRVGGGLANSEAVKLQKIAS